MKLRTVLLAVAATSALSTAAFAVPNAHDTNHPTSREQMTSSCTALESQYNSIIEGNMNAPKANKAEGLHAQGVQACESNNTDIGVHELEQAVRDLGAKPTA